MSRILICFFNLMSKFIPKEEALITLLFRGYSGSNITPLIEELNSKGVGKYNIKIINDGEATTAFKNKKISRIELYKKLLNQYWTVFKSKIIVTTHGFPRLRADSVMINLWHGIPLKSMSLMNKSKNDEVRDSVDDYFISTSGLYNTIMNACIGITADKYHITGYPRNDYLFKENGRENLSKLLEQDIVGNIVLYIPTYREKQEGLKNHDNIFNFSQFDMEQFSKFLKVNNITLLLKLHPNEEEKLLSKYKKYLGGNIFLVTSSDLDSHEMDLYKIINSVDVLITDYSSIYFDFLLLDRPIIFTPTDLDYYRDNRGLLLEPYDFWTPGPKCLAQEKLQEKIMESLEMPEVYSEKRKELRDVFHYYQDDKATERILELIENIIKE